VIQASRSTKPDADENVDSLISLIGHLVHFDSWRLGRVQGKSVVSFACASTEDQDLEIKRFLACYRRQQRRLDPREIAIVHDSVFANAVTMTLTAADGTDAMLVLLRDDSMGPFTESEYRLLALAKGLGEECLASGFAAAEAVDASWAAQRRAKPMLFILDRSYRIVMGHHADLDDDPELAGFAARFVDRLPEVIEKAVRRLSALWPENPTIVVSGVAMPLPFLSVRVHSIRGTEDHCLAVTIERMRRRDILLRASKRYLITPREREVVAYLLEGMRIDEIGECLNIAASTVNDHVKKLIERTGASNRSQMLARILGWQGSKQSEKLGRRDSIAPRT
jgi:DNA-binding CsgD family transcriptional regulator